MKLSQVKSSSSNPEEIVSATTHGNAALKPTLYTTRRPPSMSVNPTEARELLMTAYAYRSSLITPHKHTIHPFLLAGKAGNDATISCSMPARQGNSAHGDGAREGSREGRTQLTSEMK